MSILTNLFFWAFVGMFGILAGTTFVSGFSPGRNAFVGFITVIVCDFSRIACLMAGSIIRRGDCE